MTTPYKRLKSKARYPITMCFVMVFLIVVVPLSAFGIDMEQRDLAAGEFKILDAPSLLNIILVAVGFLTSLLLARTALRQSRSRRNQKSMRQRCSVSLRENSLKQQMQGRSQQECSHFNPSLTLPLQQSKALPLQMRRLPQQERERILRERDISQQEQLTTKQHQHFCFGTIQSPARKERLKSEASVLTGLAIGVSFAMIGIWAFCESHGQPVVWSNALTPVFLSAVFLQSILIITGASFFEASEEGKSPLLIQYSDTKAAQPEICSYSEVNLYGNPVSRVEAGTFGDLS